MLLISLLLSLYTISTVSSNCVKFKHISPSDAAFLSVTLYNEGSVFRTEEIDRTDYYNFNSDNFTRLVMSPNINEETVDLTYEQIFPSGSVCRDVLALSNPSGCQGGVCCPITLFTEGILDEGRFYVKIKAKRNIVNSDGNHAFRTCEQEFPACPSSFTTILGSAKCYKFSNAEVTHDAAKQNCKDLGAELLIVDQAGENTAIRAHLTSTGFGSAWTSLVRVGTSDNWVWGDNVHYIFYQADWNPGQPNNDGADGADEDCASYSVDHTWNDAECSTNMGYICKIGCPSGFQTIQGSGVCYKFSNDTVTKNDAKAKCTDLGAELLIVDQPGENEAIREVQKSMIVGAIYPNAWMSLYRVDGGDTWRWGDNSHYAFKSADWNDNEPSNGADGTEDCVNYYNVEQKWNDHTCDTSFRYICKIQRCPIGFKKIPGSSKCYSYQNETATQAAAKQKCTDLGAELLILDQPEESAAILTYMLANSLPNTWVSLTRVGTTDNWVWGDSVNYAFDQADWNDDGSPDVTEGCVEFTTVGDQKWNDIQCDENRKYMCRIGCLPGFKRIKGSDKCYRFSTDTANHNDAKQKCSDLGAELLILDQPGEITAIEEYFTQTDTNFPSAYISLTRVGDSSAWVWGDTSALDQSHWNTDEPNDAGGNEDCVTIKDGIGKWNDVSCDDSFRYICRV